MGERLARVVARACLAGVVLCAGLALGSQLLVTRCSLVSGTYAVAVVLGGGVEPGGLAPSTLGRVVSGVGLYQAGRVARLHMTGAGSVAGVSNGEAMAREAVRRGVPADVVTWEGESRSTLENALFSLPFLPAQGDVIVVTEPYHAWRGAASFRWAGRAVTACGSQGPGATGWGLAQAMGRESAAWGVNLLRGAVWRGAAMIGVSAALPEAFLH